MAQQPVQGLKAIWDAMNYIQAFRYNCIHQPGSSTEALKQRLGVWLHHSKPVELIKSRTILQ